jgi:hypothetical protein
MNYESITRRLSMLAVVGLLSATFAAGETREQLATEKEGLELIRQLEEVARDVRYDAGRLNSLAGSPHTTRWTHSHHLDQIKGLINDGLRPALARLSEIQPQLPAWKQSTIDKMLDCARTLAADATSAILLKNETGATPPMMNAEYKAALSKIYEHAEMLVKTSDAAGTYAAARLKASEAGVKVPKK